MIIIRKWTFPYQVQFIQFIVDLGRARKKNKKTKRPSFEPCLVQQTKVTQLTHRWICSVSDWARRSTRPSPWQLEDGANLDGSKNRQTVKHRCEKSVTKGSVCLHGIYSSCGISSPRWKDAVTHLDAVQKLKGRQVGHRFVRESLLIIVRHKATAAGWMTYVCVSTVFPSYLSFGATPQQWTVTRGSFWTNETSDMWYWQQKWIFDDVPQDESSKRS